MSVLPGLVFTIIGLVLNVISIGIPYWMKYKITILGVVVPVHEGLWTACFNGGSYHTCGELNDVSNWLNACRAMMIIGTVCIVIGIVLIVFGLRTNKTFRSAGIFVIVGGVCCIIAAIVYGSKFSHRHHGLIHDNPDLHAGFGLAIAAGVFAVIGGILLVKSTIYSAEYSLI